MSKNTPPDEITRLIAAFGHAAGGLKAVCRHPAFFTELVVACAAIPLAFFIEMHSGRRAILVGSIMLVLIVELLNTGIEAAIDRISTEWHPLSKFAKDVGSAAVLLSIINAALLWLIILLG